MEATTTSTEESKPVSQRKKKEVQKKQSPEPIFTDKDNLISSTPAKTTEGLVTQKKISKSTDNMAAVNDSQTYPLDRSACPTSLKNISGRRSLRPMKDYVFQHTTNNSLRESYKKINTELDVANISNNTSMNVTVGSEAPSNWSFSFLGRSRKRDRTSPEITSETGVNDMDSSPTNSKRARFDFSGIVGYLASPVTMLRERLSRTRIQTPHKLRLSDQDDHIDVANVSSASIEEEKKSETENVDVEIVDIDVIKEQNKEKIEGDDCAAEDQPSIAEIALEDDEGESEVTETEPRKKGGCLLM